MESSSIINQKTKFIAYGIRNNHSIKCVLVITKDNEAMTSLREKIALQSIVCLTVSYDRALDVIAHQSPHIVLVEIADLADNHVWDFIKTIKKRKSLPVIGLVSVENFVDIDKYGEMDDFIFSPYNDTELVIRIHRLLKRTSETDINEQIRCDGLIIDTVTCEVTVDGKKADLTFKEYELLKLMASNRGRVFTREALLDKIWGYDYYGGDRTVDVHMRRLRSKIEDANRTYIETVRNIGYKFVKDNQLA